MTAHLRDDVQKDPATLEREADQARATLQQTFETLEARLSPGELLDRSIEIVKENGGAFSRNLGVQVRNNPIPTMLAGIGIAWLVGASKDPARSRITTHSDLRGKAASLVDAAQSGSSSIAHGTRNVLDKTKSAATSVAGATRNAAGTVNETSRAAADAASLGAKSVRDGFVYLQREQPLALGALAVAAGAALGAAFSSTHAEDRVLGETSEDVKERLREFGDDTLTRAEQKAADVADAVEDALDPAE